MAVYFDVAGERLTLGELTARSGRLASEVRLLIIKWGWTAEQVLHLVPPGPRLEGPLYAADRARNEERYRAWVKANRPSTVSEAEKARHREAVRASRAEAEAIRAEYHAGVAARKAARKVKQAEAAARAAATVIPKSITVDGVTDTVAGWARRNGLTKEGIRLRIKSGMDPKDAVTLPRQKKGRKS